MLFNELQCDVEQMDTLCDPSYSCSPDDSSTWDCTPDDPDLVCNPDIGRL